MQRSGGWLRILVLVLVMPHICGSDVELDYELDDDQQGAGAAEEAHELLRRGSGQVWCERAVYKGCGEGCVRESRVLHLL
jgi:hypothetical protein